jgi:hypothetical protein
MMELRWVQALTYAAIIWAAGRLFADRLKSRAFALLATASVLFSYPLLWISAFGWSEAIFTLLGILLMLFLTRALEKPAVSTFAPLILVAALAPLARYVGAIFIATGGAAILLLMSGSVRKRVQAAILFGGLSSLPFALWLARNYHLSGTLMGPRFPPGTPLGANLNLTYRELSQWFTPTRFGLDYRGAGALAVAVAVLLLIVIYLRRDRLAEYKTLAIRNLPLVVFVALYLAFFIYFTTNYQLTSIDTRYLAPIYVFVMSLGFLAVEQIAIGLRQRTGKTLPTVLIRLAVALWLIHPITQVRDTIDTTRKFSKSAQATYSEWRSSDLIQQLKAHPVEGTVYANVPLYVLLHTTAAARPVPADLDGWAKTIRNLTGSQGEVLLIWFDDFRQCDFTRHYCVATSYQIEDLAKDLHVETLISASDGHVYRLTAVLDQ